MTIYNKLKQTSKSFSKKKKKKHTQEEEERK